MILDVYKRNGEKGITMIMLTIAIIVLAVVTGMLVYYSTDAMDIKKLNNMYNDIDLLKDKILMYDYKNGRIPILLEYPEVTSILGSQKSNLDNEKYYVIDLSKLEDITLNFGEDFKLIEQNYKNTDFNITDYKDVYVINEQTNNVYYIRGIEVDNKIYHTQKIEEEQEIQMKSTQITSIEDLIRFSQNVTNGKTYENEYVLLTRDLDFENANSYDGTEIVIDSIQYSYGGTNDLKTYLCKGGIGWTPIGTAQNTFLGTFEGKNHTIRNVYTSKETNKLFFAVDTGKVVNINIEWK